jgi:hypothetical protein
MVRILHQCYDNDFAIAGFEWVNKSHVGCVDDGKRGRVLKQVGIPMVRERLSLLAHHWLPATSTLTALLLSPPLLQRCCGTWRKLDDRFAFLKLFSSCHGAEGSALICAACFAAPHMHKHTTRPPTDRALWSAPRLLLTPQHLFS